MKEFSAYIEDLGEIGYVEQVQQSIVHISGLPHVHPRELVAFEYGSFGEIISVKEQVCEVLVFSKHIIKIGEKVARTNHSFEIPVGVELLGKTISPTGHSLHMNNFFSIPTETRPIYTSPLGIDKRKRIKKSLSTGVSMVDLLLPIGKGQRELIIGDRKTGKTQFLLQTIHMQAKEKTICIYAGIGKTKLDIKSIEDFFQKQNILEHTIIVASHPEDPSGIIYLTPYVAMTIAEYFRDMGLDVLVVLDDLSTHAKFCREIALIGKKFPGRDSYPADIFSVHAQLLERAGNFIYKDKEVSITCLPIAETTQGDLSGYIPTNLMSMTDGHIYFDNNFFTRGRRPAINPFLSVTRVGRQTQGKIVKEINRELSAFLTLFEKMSNFIHFGAELTASTKITLSTGEKIIHFFAQNPYSILDLNLQIVLFCLLWNSTWESKNSELMKKDMDKIIQLYTQDKLFQKSIDELILHSNSFNEFLGILRRETKTMFPYIEKV